MERHCCDQLCDQGRNCPEREGPTPRDIRILRALAIYAVVFWIAIGGAALALWPK